MSSGDNKQSQMEGLATLLVLDEEIRKLSTLREFGFFTTNETHRLTAYHTAYLWQLKDFIGTYLIAQSGTVEIDTHAPLNQWLIGFIDKIRGSATAKDIQQIDFEEDSTAENPIDKSEWPEDMPRFLLWCPLLDKSNKLTGGMIFFRDTAFAEHEIKMLGWLVASYQYTWIVLSKPQKIPSWEKFKEKPYYVALGLVVLGIMVFPVRLSVFAEGTVAPKSPALINSPIQGVIKAFAVSPGDTVKAGQLLLTMDKTDLQATAEVAEKDYLLTEAKLRTSINQGFDNKESSSEIPILKAQLAIDKAHFDYAKELLAKAEIKSPSPGIVIFDSKEDWIGQPVKTGERILVVADPKHVKLKITLPVKDSMKLSLEDEGDFFLYGQLNSLPITITALGYNAKLMPSKILAYELSADFINTNDLPELGAQGTVKIYGRYVPMIYYVFRKPLQALRQTLGI